MVIGTPEYMSPEQALGKRGDDIDGRSDLYSLGIVMYRMLTGELPFKAETTVEMILQHLRTPPIPPHLAKPELAIPEAVSAIVMKALEKDREKRFATGAEMAAAFKKARGSITLHSRKIDWRAFSIVWDRDSHAGLIHHLNHRGSPCCFKPCQPRCSFN
jgi:serine/threonine-protein kinase